MTTHLKNTKSSLKVILVVFSLTACNTLYRVNSSNWIKIEARDSLVNNAKREIKVQYLGAGGVYIIRGQNKILVDPYFSNISFFSSTYHALFPTCKGIKPDNYQVLTGMHGLLNKPDLSKLQLDAILVSHSHTDHLLDVPTIYNILDYKPKVFLNRSGYNTCYSVIDRKAMFVLESFQEQTTSGLELKSFLIGEEKNVRVYPLPVCHNPHFKHIKTFDGHVAIPNIDFTMPSQSTRGKDWLEGKSYAFLIDFLEADTIAFRIFIQSSSCNFDQTILPGHLNFKTKPVDLALLGISSFKFSPNYPMEHIQFFKPKRIEWIHWENFFRKPDKQLKTVMGTNIRKFFKQPDILAIKNNYRTPYPMASLFIRY